MEKTVCCRYRPWLTLKSSDCVIKASFALTSLTSSCSSNTSPQHAVTARCFPFRPVCSLSISLTLIWPLLLWVMMFYINQSIRLYIRNLLFNLCHDLQPFDSLWAWMNNWKKRKERECVRIQSLRQIKLKKATQGWQLRGCCIKGAVRLQEDANTPLFKAEILPWAKTLSLWPPFL